MTGCQNNQEPAFNYIKTEKQTDMDLNLMSYNATHYNTSVKYRYILT